MSENKIKFKLVVRDLQGNQQFDILEYFLDNSKEIAEDVREMNQGVILRGSRASVKEALGVPQEFWTFVEIASELGVISWFVSKLLDLLKKYVNARLEIDDKEVPLTKEDIEKIIDEKLKENDKDG